MPAKIVNGSQQESSQGSSSDTDVEKLINDFGIKLQRSLEATKREIQKTIAAEQMMAVKKDLGIAGKSNDNPTGENSPWFDNMPPEVQKQIKKMTEEQPEMPQKKDKSYMAQQIAVTVCAKESEFIARVWFDTNKEQQTYQDLKLLDWAIFFEFMPNGRAKFHLQHYLQGSGKPLHFELKQMLNDNPKIRQRISKEIIQRLDPALPASFRFDPAAVKAHEFPIRQSDYNNETAIGKDWHFAVGTYFIFWEIVEIYNKTRDSRGSDRGPICVTRLGRDFIDLGTLCRTRSISPVERTANKRLGDLESLPKYARIFGVKEYHWHAITDRADAAVHAAGFRLKGEIGAKNYDMIGDPCVIEIATGQPIQ